MLDFQAFTFLKMRYECATFFADLTFIYINFANEKSTLKRDTI
jgi:hypothetical protein